MDEAAFIRKGIFYLKRIFLDRKKKHSGQALVEYLMILMLALLFTRLIYFNKEFGFKGVLDKTMLRLGSFLEQNLKTGTQVGKDGENSLDPYAGTDTWKN